MATTAATITMSMREVDRVTTVQAVVDRMLPVGLAAKRLGLSRRQLERLLLKYKAHGAAGLVSAKRGHPSNHQLAPGAAERALRIIRDRYADFGPTLACEKHRRPRCPTYRCTCTTSAPEFSIRVMKLRRVLWKSVAAPSPSRSRSRPIAFCTCRDRRSAISDQLRVSPHHRAGFMSRERDKYSACDAIALRAVLAYVHDKPSALREALRILKPGGRISIAEPILQDDALNAIALRRMIDSGVGGEHSEMLRLMHRWKAAQFPDTSEALAANSLVNFSERDLVELFRDAGFEDIRMELHISVLRTEGLAWSTFIATSPHPLAPTLRRILADHFNDEERWSFERLFRSAIEAGLDHAVERVAYLTAGKPRESQLRASVE